MNEQSDHRRSVVLAWDAINKDFALMHVSTGLPTVVVM
jgi:hypothetical protein